MSEGHDVRVAFDGPDIDHDGLLSEIEARNREDKVRASSAGESRQKIGEFLEDTSMNSKAFAWCRQIIKQMDKASGQEKAMDIIRSLKSALPMVEAHVAGQGTYDMDLDEGEPVAPDDYSDDETAAFNAEVDAVADDKVQPIDFGAAAE